MAQELRKQPTQLLPALESAIQNVYRNNYAGENEVIPTFQAQVQSDENPRMLRDLQSNLMGSLVVVPGIVTAASKSAIKATKEILRCTNCGHEKTVNIKLGYGGARHPRICEATGEAG